MRYTTAAAILLTLRRFIARVLNPFHPGTGRCLRCYRNWDICEEHATQFSREDALFPLCETCWQELTPEQRLPYYHMLWNEWNVMGGDCPPDEWNAIEQAVKAGK